MSSTQHKPVKEQPTIAHAGRLSGADVMATLLVAAAATVSIVWFTDAALSGWSTRLLAAVVFALGYVGCMTARARMAQVYGAQGHHRASMAYVVVTSALGAAALVGGVAALVWESQAGLVVLVAATVALWALATARHSRTAP